MYRGTLKKVFIEKWFGFIRVDGIEQPDVFVHFSQLVNANPKDIIESTGVTFDIATNQRCGKSQAVNVRLLSPLQLKAKDPGHGMYHGGRKWTIQKLRYCLGYFRGVLNSVIWCFFCWIYLRTISGHFCII